MNRLLEERLNMRNDPNVLDTRTNTPATTTVGSKTLSVDDLEAAVARIWAEVLGVDHVALHDNFLLLGGESLLATQVVSQIRARLGCNISIRSVFVGTVAEVAAELAAMIAVGDGTGSSGSFADMCTSHVATVAS